MNDNTDIFSLGDDHTNACLNFLHEMGHGYVEGYKRAAKTLVCHVDSTGRDCDYLVYPIIFLYRQHIELILKRIIKKDRELDGKKPSAPEHHRLHDLWNLTKGMIRKLEPDGIDPAEFALMDSLVAQFKRHDPDNQAARFDVLKSKERSFADVTCVNINRFSEFLNRCSEFLDCVLMHLHHTAPRRFENGG